MEPFPHMPGEYLELHRRIVAVDPSGNFENGHGHTGIAYMTVIGDAPKWNSACCTSISAKEYPSRHEYWKAILSKILDLTTPDDILVLEKYVVRNNGFTIGKAPETAMLLGVLVYEINEQDPTIRIVEQTPAQAKRRFTDTILEGTFPGLVQKSGRWYMNEQLINEHCRDALRHLAYCVNYNL